MSHREKRFVVEIQMKQLRTNEPLADDYYYQKYVERWLAKNLNKEKEAKEEGADETVEVTDEKEKVSHQQPLQEANVEHPPDKSAAEREKMAKEQLEKEKIETEKENKINEKKHLTIPVATMSTALEATIAALSVGANQKMQNKNKKNKNHEDKLESVDEKNNKSDENSDANSRAESPNPEQQINRKSKHSDALGRMVKSSHYNPRKMIEIGDTEDADISFQKRMLPMRHVEDALLSIILLIQTPQKSRNKSIDSTNSSSNTEKTRPGKPEQSNRDTKSNSEKPHPDEENPEEPPVPTEEEIQEAALEQLKVVLGFNNPDGSESTNKEDTVIRQWSVVLRWRKGRTLVQRSILALSVHNEIENATIALRFICRCMRHLIMSENIEREQLPEEKQRLTYQSTLDQNFQELQSGINVLPGTACFESLLELLGVAEDDGEKCLVKFDQIGMSLDEILHTPFTLSLFVVLFERLFEESMGAKSREEGISKEEKDKRSNNFQLILEYLRGAVLKEGFAANDLPNPLIKITQLPELLRLVGINASFK